MRSWKELISADFAEKKVKVLIAAISENNS
jgi:hypothetical protein